MTPAQHWRDQLRHSLLSARKSRDTTRVTAIRSALSAIDNAETPQADRTDTRIGGSIAGAVSGVGSTEIARRVLSDAEIRDLIQAEVDEQLTAADEYIAGGHHERASDLQSQAAVLTQMLSQESEDV
ncbi:MULTISPECIES: glutamyl-tRNA amidotransferase [unclassified Mycolicibacterium]|uniref:glutamyl-tRNA amidotransferase n=1 Tax=unclassified Mycolicibacterium TaxID=2636767 RepID=UPI0012DD6AB9|nr:MULTISPECIES: glutamyl-tRNA amidotransferase [unclassified Mycolicibacterium]MUL80734.1 glutamyl-tRNA amidotransferase [Mycolicibacterium sp. CBMA 329]MUL86501.1 glutamyl-tRNA amidotransferase [Mycolicibacterium sp. CBMA 331]MUM01363.1 glutamyl-tRNA amidotransferase [Mycolicibacterium sp. CBMA 334]MUM25873.1 glutamyl-tRNA amidotransferase [Mycolicibacterium sp. CBMA 295]MUM36797.1 glutamyl-tRNA amidotransferase [Mycolicibacterium sp. CBMA 247]